MAGVNHAPATLAPEPVVPELWRTAEELTGSAEFREMISLEFPEDADTWTDEVSRRNFLTLMGASIALAGLGGCSPRPASPQKILPYTVQPAGMTLGVPQVFTSASVVGGFANGIMVRSNEGRPTKVEGNPLHPGSLGGTDIFAQAMILSMYDPDRSQATLYLGASQTWENALVTLRGKLNELKNAKDSGVRVLTETVTSPSFKNQIDLFTKKHSAKWIQYEPTTRDEVREGAKQAFGVETTVVYDFTQANIVLSLDADFLTVGPGSVRYARDFASRRKVRTQHEDGGSPKEMNRLYAVESMLTPTGAVADHRLPLKSSDIGTFTRALAKALKVEGAPPAGEASAIDAWIAPLVADLDKNRGKCLVVVGDHQPASVHALGLAINQALGNIGTTVNLVKPVEAQAEGFGGSHLKAFAELVKEMKEGKVKLLLILGGNPIFNSPVDLDFKTALGNVDLRIHLGLYQDETAVQCHWHIPEAHPLECWGDAKAYDGTSTIIQPLIAPLYSGKSALEVLAALAADPAEAEQSGHDVVKAYWKKWYEQHEKDEAKKEEPKKKDKDDKEPKEHKHDHEEVDFDSFWHTVLDDGIVDESKSEPLDSKKLADGWAGKPGPATWAGTMELCLRTDPTIHDGRYANLGWLQELPKPVSKVCWENVAIMSPKTAQKLGLSAFPRWTAGERGRTEVDFFGLSIRGRTVPVPAWIQPGHVDDSVTLYFGYGRTRAGNVGNNTGVDAYTLRGSDTLWTTAGLEIKKVARDTFIACTQTHHSMENRKPIRRMTLAEYGDKKTLEMAMAPPVAAAEYDLIKQNVPGPYDVMEKEKTEKYLQSDEYKKKHAGHHHDHEHPHEHHHDKRLVPLTMYNNMVRKEDRRWAMAIDLTSCSGCNVCMIACMAENNIPVIGKHEVTRGREMFWIRVDRYHEGDPMDSESLTTYFQPVPCQQCEKAPCEVVCPVGATTHSTDGLNDMVYNRCVGTRYCSNNCPYKVRRFNFFSYANYVTETLKLGRNPEVTVRSRGVMEKCTYCVQRIRAAEIVAEREYRPIADGEIVTACQAACPSGCISFGDLADVESEVRRWKSEPTNYALLAELNTMPRTTYLAALRNPNPAMKSKGA